VLRQSVAKTGAARDESGPAGMRIILLLTLLAAPAVARAEATPTAFDDFEAKPKVFTHPYRPLDNRLELTLFFTPSVVDKYLNHTGGAGALSFHFNDIVAIEGLGGYVYAKEVDIIGGPAGVRALSSTGAEPNLPDLVGMSWFAMGNLELSPIYGKINLLSEVDFNSQIYVMGGVGAVGAVKYFRVPGGTQTQTELTNQGVKFAGDFGIGFRLFLLRWMAIRAEFRDILYTDSYDFVGKGQKDVDFIHNFMGFFGLSFILNS
jgi:outer membrane beta-barrel protein